MTWSQTRRSVNDRGGFLGAGSGNTVRRVDGEVVGIACAGENSVGWCRAGVLNVVSWINEKAMKRVSGGSLRKMGAEGKAVQQFGGGGLSNVGARGKAVGQSGGGF